MARMTEHRSQETSKDEKVCYFGPEPRSIAKYRALGLFILDDWSNMRLIWRNPDIWVNLLQGQLHRMPSVTHQRTP